MVNFLLRFLWRRIRSGVRFWPGSSGFQSGDAGQGFAFHPLKERSTCGRDIGEVSRCTGLIESGYSVAAACNADQLAGFGQAGGLLGGGMANTFLAARSIDVGKSLCEHDMADTAREILAKAEETGCKILLPVDVVVAREFKAGAENETVAADACPADAMILDAGPETVAAVADTLANSKTLIWNGPMGAFEIAPFDAATNAAAQQAASLTKSGQLVSVAGGGDTVAALNQAGAAADFTYISTAGGAFLEWMEGKTLPGVAALEG